MNSQWYETAKVLAQLKGESFPSAMKPETPTDDTARVSLPSSNKITVIVTGDASLMPDIAKVYITHKTLKQTVEAAKHSIQRRTDYILQTLRNNAVKESHFTVHKNLERIDDQFQMSVEVYVEFHDFKVCEQVCNFLVEKLDESVMVSKPIFCHSPGKLDSIRQQACLNAVRNAKSKAMSISQFLNQKLGSAVEIKEEEISELTGSGTSEQHVSDFNIKGRIEASKVTVTIKITASFEIESKNKKKHQ